jgi:hypothetical protein
MSAESQNCEASREPLLGNGSEDTSIDWQWLSIRHVMAATDARNNMRAVGSGVFSAVRAEAIG